MTLLLSLRNATSVVMYASMVFLMGRETTPTKRDEFAVALQQLRTDVFALPDYDVKAGDAAFHATISEIEDELLLVRAQYTPKKHDGCPPDTPQDGVGLLVHFLMLQVIAYVTRWLVVFWFRALVVAPIRLAVRSVDLVVRTCIFI